MAVLSAMVMHTSPSRGQGTSETVRLNTAFYGENFAPASPDVSAMLRYGDCSLDLFHGRMGLQIPLYEYSDRDFTIPFTLGYSTQGYQPGLDCGVCGLGWTLMCGGCITREVRGIPDDAKGLERIWKWHGDRNMESTQIGSNPAAGWGYDLSNALRDLDAVNIDGYHAIWAMDNEEHEQQDTLDYYYEGALNHDYEFYWRNPESAYAPRFGYETQSDIYHFNFLGVSGDFVLQPGRRIVVYNCSIPSGCVEVEWNWETGSVHWSTFTIRTGDGMRYDFEQSESSCCYDLNKSEPDERTNITWLLTRVTAPSGIYAEFRYSPINGGSMSYSAAVCIDRLKITGTDGKPIKTWCMGEGEDMFFVNKEHCTFVNSSEYYRLESVEIAGRMRARFIYDSTGHLGHFIVSNSGGREIRHAMLSYSEESEGRALLKSVGIAGQGRWSFVYDSEDDPLPRMDTPETDNLGFYNGSEAYKHISIPPYQWGQELESYANGLLQSRHPVLEYARMGALTEIQWPTGGRSAITYGLNKALDNGIVTDSYGIRPESIVTYDSDGAVLQRRNFIYTDDDGVCSGILLNKPQIYFRYRIESSSLLTEREAVSTQSSVGLGPKAFQEYHTVIERISGDNPDEGVSETVHRYQTSVYDGLSNLTEYYTSVTGDVAVGEGGWDYSYSNFWSPSDRQMMGERYSSGGETAAVERDKTAGLTVSSTVRQFSDVPVSSVSITPFPAMLSNIPCEHIVNPRHVYSSSQTDSTWCGGAVQVTDSYTEIDSYCRPVERRTMSGTDALTVTTTYLGPGSLLPAETTQASEVVTGGEKVDYKAKAGTDGRPWHLPWRHYRFDTGANAWVKDSEIISYDRHGNPTAIVDAKGNRTELEWSPDGTRLLSQTVHPAGGESLVTRWEWIPLVGPTKREDPSGRVTEWHYDENGRLVRTDVCGDTAQEAEYNIATE